MTRRCAPSREIKFGPICSYVLASGIIPLAEITQLSAEETPDSSSAQSLGRSSPTSSLSNSTTSSSSSSMTSSWSSAKSSSSSTNMLLIDPVGGDKTLLDRLEVSHRAYEFVRQFGEVVRTHRNILLYGSDKVKENLRHAEFAMQFVDKNAIARINKWDALTLHIGNGTDPDSAVLNRTQLEAIETELRNGVHNIVTEKLLSLVTERTKDLAHYLTTINFEEDAHSEDDFNNLLKELRTELPEALETYFKANYLTSKLYELGIAPKPLQLEKSSEEIVQTPLMRAIGEKLQTISAAGYNKGKVTAKVDELTVGDVFNFTLESLPFWRDLENVCEVIRYTQKTIGASSRADAGEASSETDDLSECSL